MFVLEDIFCNFCIRKRMEKLSLNLMQKAHRWEHKARALGRDTAGLCSHEGSPRGRGRQRFDERATDARNEAEEQATVAPHI
jgi:hypothetical protein